MSGSRRSSVRAPMLRGRSCSRRTRPTSRSGPLAYWGHGRTTVGPEPSSRGRTASCAPRSWPRWSSACRSGRRRSSCSSTTRVSMSCWTRVDAETTRGPAAPRAARAVPCEPARRAVARQGARRGAAGLGAAVPRRADVASPPSRRRAPDWQSCAATMRGSRWRPPIRPRARSSTTSPSWAWRKAGSRAVEPSPKPRTRGEPSRRNAGWGTSHGPAPAGP